jgi:hypothetical protein
VISPTREDSSGTRGNCGGSLFEFECNDILDDLRDIDEDGKYSSWWCCSCLDVA